MSTLEMAIDARQAKDGSVQFSMSANEIKRAATEAAGSIDGLNKSTSSLGGTIAKYLAGYVTFETLKGIFKEASISEQAERRLAIAIGLTGSAREKAMTNLTGFANQLQRLTGIEDEEIKKAMTLGRNMGLPLNDLKIATEAAVGLSAKYNMGLEESITLLARAKQGSTDMGRVLRAHGIAIDSTRTAQERYNELIKRGIVGIDEAKVVTGEWTKLWITLKEAAKGIAAEIERATQDSAKTINTAITANTEALKRYRQQTGDVRAETGMNRMITISQGIELIPAKYPEAYRQILEQVKSGKNRVSDFVPDIDNYPVNRKPLHSFSDDSLTAAAKVEIQTQAKQDQENRRLAIENANAASEDYMVQANHELELSRIANDAERDRAATTLKLKEALENLSTPQDLVNKHLQEYNDILKETQRNNAAKEIIDMTQALRDETAVQSMSNLEREHASDLLLMEKMARDGVIDNVDKTKEAYMKEAKVLEDAQKLRAIADGVGDSFGRAFEDMALGAKTAGEAVRALALDVAKLVMHQMITQPIAQGISFALMGAFSGAGSAGTGNSTGQAMQSGTTYAAKGYAFNNGEITPFANGGIVNHPTIFPMARGYGLMGEAGPEAVMPLTRTSDGRLGVRSSLGNGGNIEVINKVEIINQSNQPMSAKAGNTRFDGKQYVTEIIINDLNSYGPIRQAMQSQRG